MSPSGPPTVSIVIATWNGRHMLETCLASVAALDYPRAALEVVVVDNGSVDDTVAWLGRAHPTVRLVRNEENRGFAAASNQGAEAAAGALVAFVNNDVRLERSWLRPLVDALAADDVVVAGSRMLDWEGRRIDFDGAAMSFDGHGVSVGYGRPVEAVPAGDPAPALFACGGAMLADRERFLGVGGFDAEYFAYFEDVDLGWRVWVQGGRVLHVPAAVAHHRHHGSGIAVDRRARLLARNALVSVVKNYDDANLAVVLPAALALVRARATVAGEREAAIHEDTVAEFEAGRGALEVKRARVQAGRRRRDCDILPLFAEPLRPSVLGTDYWRAHRAIVRAHGIDELFGGADAGLAAFVDELQWRIAALEGELAALRAAPDGSTPPAGGSPLGAAEPAGAWRRLWGRRA
jgi:hypothetical protein